MYAQLRADLPQAPSLAVILNRHARGVSPQVVRRLGRLLPPQDLFLSHSVSESNAIAETVVDRGYRAVLLGGGDGTFVQCLTDLRAHAARRGLDLPSVGVLKLGTGNALAYALDASPVSEAGLRRTIERACDPAHEGDLPLLEVDGRLTPFAGVGLDAGIQQDFAATTRLLDRFGLGRHLGAGARYALAVGLRSTPRYFFAQLPEVFAINRGSPALRVGKGGEIVGGPIAAGEVLFRGRCTLATAATIPFFGLGMKMFPYAQLRRGRFQLRCAQMSTAAILGNLPSIWRGDYGSDDLGDFLVDKIELRLERPVPYQIGGDLQPLLRDHLTIAMAKHPIRVVH